MTARRAARLERLGSARAYAANKQFGKAVALETKVVEEAPPEAKEGEQKSLQEYTQKAAAKK